MYYFACENVVLINTYNYYYLFACTIPLQGKGLPHLLPFLSRNLEPMLQARVHFKYLLKIRSKKRIKHFCHRLYET